MKRLWRLTFIARGLEQKNFDIFIKEKIPVKKISDVFKPKIQYYVVSCFHISKCVFL